jgi:superfamily II DNA or RNA helicase
MSGKAYIRIGDAYSEVVKAPPNALAIIRTVCRARPNGFQYMPRYRSGMWDGYISLMRGLKSFPTGMLKDVRNVLDSHRIRCVYSHSGSNLCEFEEDDIYPGVLAGGVVLRNYQLGAVCEMIGRRGIAKMATNAGKTVVYAALIKIMGNSNAMIIVQSKDLLYQTRDRLATYLDRYVGIAGDSKFDKSDVMVATIQTLSSVRKRANRDTWAEMFGNNRILVVDECFVAGTLIDGVPIESISVGDIVHAVDRQGHVVLDRVTHVFRKRAPNRLYSVTCDGTSVVCTGNHPFLSRDGTWLPASALNAGDLLCGWRCDNAEKIVCENVRMHVVRGNFHEESWRYLLEEVFGWDDTSVLQEGVQFGIQSYDIFEDDDKNECTVQLACISLKEDVRGQSYDSSRSCRQDEGISHESRKLGAASAWWEWHTAANANASKDFGARIGRLEHGIRRIVQTIGCGILQPAQSATLLQSGHRERGCNVGHRGRWKFAPLYATKGSRQKEGKGIEIVRVDCVEILERGDTGRYDKLCGDGYVYNIETERTHTYIANGFVVHNCHHIANNKTFDVLMEIPGWHRYGVSGTPLDRGVLNDLKLIACTGPVLTEMTNAELIDDGWSAKPIIHVHEIDDVPLLSYDGKSAMDEDYVFDDLLYQEAYDKLIVDNPNRNAVARDVALKAYHDGKSVLIIVRRISHGRHLVAGVCRAGVLGVFVSGSSSMAERSQALSLLGSGQPCIVVATNIFDEGVDVPSLDVVVLACGGKSHIKLLQRIGRGLRRKEGANVVHIHDFMDVQNKHLLNHAEGRLDVYEKEDFDVRYEE